DNNIIDLGENYTYNTNNKIVTKDANFIKLTKKELGVLDLFCKNIDQYITYDIFREYIWIEKDIADSTIRDTILRLRKKIPNLQIISTKGLGYILQK
ncbi:MAG: winged helix-turn-helix domain-containing protein, partial [Campylobacterota bacterium]|nr:winged helix-turn-helix domain-containing protein [Campylobacterota bacterium]